MPLRFTIRDLLWLTLVVALALGWWIDGRKVATTINDLKAELHTYNWAGDPAHPSFDLPNQTDRP